MTDLVVLLGHDIGYSASPAMHNAAFAAFGMDAQYELADVGPHGLADAIDALRTPGRLGANVTQPHKLAVCDLVGDRLVAHNTDLPAVTAELGGLGSVRRAVVLGNGGASRAVQAALPEFGATVAVVGRGRWSELPSLLADADLLVNATPIGTGSDESPVGTDLLRPDLAVFDLVYRPTPTRLVDEARALGATARGGAGMLLRQAAASFELWTGVAAPVDVMRDALRRELGPGIDA
jgi:shikimate dehydrogenase